MKSFNEWLDEGSFLHHMGNSAKYAMSAVGFTDKNKFDRVNALKFWKKYLEQPMPFPRSWTDPRFSGLLRILNGTEDQYTTFGWDIYMSPQKYHEIAQKQVEMWQGDPRGAKWQQVLDILNKKYAHQWSQ